ncbi:hypothetical protein N7457_000036 [Penicillium paradoxum]|uniref:uncharacterized protein n=1 Tax=Penicillium paradoxum TaxID=176176 RepID=UPI00254679D8|nr:uncharacterized protein N7457_000036 [Penicillium paradoxum]KAJ5793437.1 hypothetical protein N7457_000036 [Penicillium paradoxum]
MHSFLLLCVFGGHTAALAGQSSPELRVVTSSGTLKGIYNNSAQTVRAFLGIPYAEPPIRELRWEPPRAKSPSSIDASSFGRSCPQVHTYSNESIYSILPYKIWDSGTMSEDCLYMNIWAPAIKHRGHMRAPQKAAVMLFVHGGGYGSGSGSIVYYDGTNLVQENDDIIVVTFNYRLNVFGFPNAPGIDPLKQNLGILDQRLAIKWVRKNIVKFGGDPEKILLFGQSAGASSADIISYAYPDAPLVSALALHSGTVSLLITHPDHQNWNKLSATLGCGTGSKSLQCMRQVPAMKIVRTRAQGNYNFYPIEDNHLVFSDHAARAKKGKLAFLPTLAGSNEREYSAFVPLSQSSVNETALYEQGQLGYNCPLQKSTRIRVDQNVPTWRYLYHGNFTNLSPVPWLGAYHGSEIPLVFGNYNLSSTGIPPSTRVVEASKYIQGAWVAFAKNPCTGLSKYGWPKFSFHRQSALLIFFLFFGQAHVAHD